MAITLSDLNLNQPLPVQLGEVTNYVVINDTDYPPLSCTVVNGYDAFGNALSSVQIFPRVARLVYELSESDIITDSPDPIQLSKVTAPIPIYNDNTDFPALSTTIVYGYDAYGNALSSVQIFPRTVELGFFGTVASFDKYQPNPIQLSEVTNYFPVDETTIYTLSTTVVQGYDAYGNALSSVQIFPRHASMLKEVTLDLPTAVNNANPIQLSQVTNCVQVSVNDATYYPLSTTVVNGFDAYGNAISGVQIFPRTSSLVHILDAGTTLDINAPLPIQLSQVMNYIPLTNDNADFPALSATIVNGYDAFGNAISSVQVYPRMVSLVYLVNP